MRASDQSLKVIDDEFMVAADFDTAGRNGQIVLDRILVARGLSNTARMGWFSAGRAIRDYAEDIWRSDAIKPSHLTPRPAPCVLHTRAHQEGAAWCSLGLVRTRSSHFAKCYFRVRKTTMRADGSVCQDLMRAAKPARTPIAKRTASN